LLRRSCRSMSFAMVWSFGLVLGQRIEPGRGFTAQSSAGAIECT
jgi:hypothetical protein